MVVHQNLPDTLVVAGIFWLQRSHLVTNLSRVLELLIGDGEYVFGAFLLRDGTFMFSKGPLKYIQYTSVSKI